MKKSTILLLCAFVALVLAYLLPHWITITLAIITVAVNAFLFGCVIGGALIVSNPDLYKACRENDRVRTKHQKVDELIGEIFPGFEDMKLNVIEKLNHEQSESTNKYSIK